MENKKTISIWCNYRVCKIPAWVLDFLGSSKEKLVYLKNHKVEGVTVWEGHNLVPLAIRSSLAQLISGTSVTPTFKANIIALWDDDTVASYADTQLWNELKRSTFDNAYSIDNVAYLDVYFDKATIGTISLQEIGVFIDGLVWTPNSGFLLSRINTDEALNGLEDLSINCSFTISG